MPYKHPSSIRGTLTFSRSKILLLTERGEEYFVQPFALDKSYLEGDRVQAVVRRVATPGYLAEVKVQKLIQRTQKSIYGKVTNQKWRMIILDIPREYGNIWRLSVSSGAQVPQIDDFVSIQRSDAWWRISGIIGNYHDPLTHERLILEKAWILLNFSKGVQDESENIQSPQIHSLRQKSKVPVYITEKLRKEHFDTDISFFPLARTVSPDGTSEDRVDFRHWYTLTIDGSDARDLDDAISIARYENGEWLLAVHIADVAEYVREWSIIDQEALARTTSIYTPRRVIPMLPEVLSNDLCSLHPWSPKLVLTLLMKIDLSGNVLATFLTEWVIESRQKWVYEDISDPHEASTYEKNISHEYKSSVTNVRYLDDFFGLFYVLLDRRKNEWKIVFDSSEPKFFFDPEGKIIDITRRDRRASHMMIEEFMVLANEEVAKWCVKKNLPFLSRIHHLPPEENAKIIREIIHLENKEIHPMHIRKFLDSHVSWEWDTDILYKYSRLLLPKMAKAFYSDKVHMHFGLALKYYSHFTSPIRRYPDLQIHRIIKEELHHTLDTSRKSHYRTILKKIAKKCSDGEVLATEVERSIDALFLCQYMSDKIWRRYIGRICGLTDWALFVELNTSIEVMVSLRSSGWSRGQYHYDPVRGVLSDAKRVLYTLWERVDIEIIGIDHEERRVLWKILDKNLIQAKNSLL